MIDHITFGVRDFDRSTALALASAAAVRAVGVVDIPMAAIAGRRLFAERLSLRQGIGAVLTALGVAATAFGHA